MHVDYLNTFQVVPGEQVVKQWKVAQCCGSDCCGVHAVILTNNRLLSRSEECSYLGCLCGCCCNHPHNDSAIYLRNIAQIKSSSGGGCSLWNLLHSIQHCTCCCPPRDLMLRGSFGWEQIFVNGNEKLGAQALIPVLIAQNQSPAPTQMMSTSFYPPPPMQQAPFYSPPPMHSLNFSPEF
jgi:hypothetical protein